MRNLVLVMIAIFWASCAHKNQDVKNQSVEVVATPKVLDEKNIDIDVREKIHTIWEQYFKEDFNESRSINLFVATNRKLKSPYFGCSNQYFGIENEDTATYRLGVCKINVPKDHSTGEIEFSSDLKSNSHKYYKVIGNQSLTDQQFLDSIKKTKRIPLIFVHGFNVKFQDAVLRASQLAYDLKYQGPVILFSWPSGSGDGFLDDKMINKTYESNQKSAKESIVIFKSFIKKFMDLSVPLNLYVHSMGHQVVIPALAELGALPPIEKKYINELILNAPDYAIADFAREISFLSNVSKRITMYCSYNDKAMVASQSFNKNARLGACGSFDGVDTINVSEVDDKTFGLGHSYYSHRAVLTDVFQVLLGIEADNRLFIKKSWPNGAEKYFLRN